MKLGSYNSRNIPISSDDFGTLFTDLNKREIIIYFYRDEPCYHVHYVAVCIGHDLYDLYQHEYINGDAEIVKSVIRDIVEVILKK
jgi:hypothetical protein